MNIVDSCLCACIMMCRAYLNHVRQCFGRQQLLDTGAFDFEFFDLLSEWMFRVWSVRVIIIIIVREELCRAECVVN